ncbi:hypothetical protein GGR52DRAFT_153781 [Hypoxylon sp. FL1284]|nr:hypothetical protein GGR52DRAFT_153781 [Hypoxylon sp. FL1284]
MARPRAPRSWATACAVARIIARILGMGISVVLLADLIYESVNWGKTLGLSITAAVVALVVDGSELMGLLDSTRTIPRVSATCVVCGDMLVLCLSIPSIFLIIRSGYGDLRSDDPVRWEHADALSLNVTFAVCGLRFLLLIWSCVDCCCAIRHPMRHGGRTAPVNSEDELHNVRPIS